MTESAAQGSKMGSKIYVGVLPLSSQAHAPCCVAVCLCLAYVLTPSLANRRQPALRHRREGLGRRIHSLRDTAIRVDRAQAAWLRCATPIIITTSRQSPQLQCAPQQTSSQHRGVRTPLALRHFAAAQLQQHCSGSAHQIAAGSSLTAPTSPASESTRREHHPRLIVLGRLPVAPHLTCAHRMNTAIPPSVISTLQHRPLSAHHTCLYMFA